jgi:hypothetical protein
LVPVLRQGLLPRSLSFFGLGFGLLWIYQLHLSAVLLGPIAVAVVLLHARDDGASVRRGLPWAALGALTAGWTLVPTLNQAGVPALVHSVGSNVVFEPGNLVRLPQVVAQFFAFPAFEVARFIGAGTDARLEFLGRYWWAAPFVVVAAVLGVIQTATLVASMLQRRSTLADWPAIRSGTALLLGLVVVSFVWSVRPPASHTFYLVLPPVMIYAAYVWAPWFERRVVRALAVLLFACGAVTHVAIAWRNFVDQSLYVNRAVVVRAIAEKDDRLVGVRRPEMWKRQP